MNFQLQVPASSTDKIPWPTGFSDTLRGEFAGKTISAIFIDDDGLTARIAETRDNLKALEVEPINYDKFMRHAADLLELEGDLSVLVSQVNMAYRDASSRFKLKHAKTYLSLTDPEDPKTEPMAVTAAKARTTALCAEEDVEQQQLKKILEMYAPLQGIVTSNKQYITKVLWDLNNQNK